MFLQQAATLQNIQTHSTYFSNVPPCKSTTWKVYWVVFKLTWPVQEVNLCSNYRFAESMECAPIQHALSAIISILFRVPPWLVRAFWTPQLTHHVPSLLWLKKAAGAFASHAILKCKDQEFKGLQELWSQAIPRRFNSAKRKVSSRITVLAKSNKMKSEKENCRSYGKVLSAQNGEKKKKGKLGCVAYQHVESQFYLQ